MEPIRKAIRTGLKSLEAPEQLRLSQWAKENFYLSEESSYVEGDWNAYPFQPAMMDAMSDDEIEEVSIRKSARVGYTKMILAAIGYFAQHKRRNQAIWQPTDDDSDDFCKTELEPMLRDVKRVRAAFPSYGKRSKGNTLRAKKFLGAVLHLRGGKAGKNFRRLTVDVAYVDELDGFDLDIEKEGSAVTLSKKRLEGATFPKHILGSTPKTKGLSQIEAREGEADLVFRFFVPCPHCDHEQHLRWGSRKTAYGMKWRDDDPETAAYQCEACGVHFNQAEYLQVWTRGRWIADDGTWIDDDFVFRDGVGAVVPKPKHVAFFVWTIYSPQATWPALVRECQSAHAKLKGGDNSELKTFTNTTRGESFEEQLEKTDESELKNRAEPYPLRTVPLGGLVLLAGVDVQDNRFEVTVWAFGRGEEMWVVDYMVITANPALDEDWKKLDTYLLTRFPHAAGTAVLGIESAAVDTRGHFTHPAYNFCRQRTGRRIYAVAGATKDGEPIKGRSKMMDVNWNGRIIKSGVKLWHVGTDTAKDLLHGRLGIDRPGPGCVHFSKDLPDEFYAQLTAEGRVLQKTAYGDKYRWVKPSSHTRNEVLDTTVYALFCAQMRDLHRFTDAMWKRLEEAVQPRVGDLFAAPVAPAVLAQTVAPTPPAPAVPPRVASSPADPSSAPIPKPAAPRPASSGRGLGSNSWNSRL